jgi:hypothetical protein
MGRQYNKMKAAKHKKRARQRQRFQQQINKRIRRQKRTLTAQRRDPRATVSIVCRKLSQTPEVLAEGSAARDETTQKKPATANKASKREPF